MFLTFPYICAIMGYNWRSVMIIGFTGLIGSGKTTAAGFLIERGFARVRFSDPLKAMLAALGLTDSELNGSLKEKACSKLCGQTPRWAMQALGTEWGRELIHPELWVTLWSETVRTWAKLQRPVVVDDLRFANEAEVIKRWRGSKIIQIQRPGTQQSSHISERFVFTSDHVIHNDGTIAALREKVLEICCHDHT